MTTVLSETSNRSPNHGIIIELPLKPRKKMISMRLDEDTLMVLDKFIAYTGEYTRTLLITKIIEAVAKGLKESNYQACKLELRFLIENNNSDEKYVSVLIPLRNNK